MEETPAVCRIVAISDVFDALTSSRPNKKAWSEQETITYINEQQGKHFDPDKVAVFNSSLPEILQLKNQYAEE